ncbi:MAG: aminopeptidase [Candidatus Cloacimonadota bacterium]|nr:aminopeptidase [Candidatus Cloacimonadota bacterium]
MLNYTETINRLNEAVRTGYEVNLQKIKTICEEEQDQKNKFQKFAFTIAEKLLFYAEFEREYSEDYYKENSPDYLKATNAKLFAELTEENYSTCYANPEYTSKIFGTKLGPMFASYYTSVRSCLNFAMEHKLYSLKRKFGQFIEMYELIKTGSEDLVKYREIIIKLTKDLNVDRSTIALLERFDPAISKCGDIVMNADLSNMNYLYQYGKNISENESRTAQFLLDYPEEKIKELVKAMVKAYIRGFELARKNLKKKETLKIIYNIGQERIVRELVKNLNAKGLKVILNDAISTSPNRQYVYDHRFDSALYFDEDFVKRMLALQEEIMEDCSDLLVKYSGPIYFDKFGEKPFKPIQKKTCLKLSGEQQKLNQSYSISMNKLSQKYMPRTETSFSIIGFPVPDIGEQFEAIFEDTLALNMIDTDHHEQIQQYIVDELDKADFVHVKGKNENETDIMVKMQKLADPAKHTNFVNCGADVNIPVGEVFTSPTLEATNGVLHVKETYLNGMRYENLKINFEDGYVKEYTCTNFKDEKDNKNYIQENILFPHETLPMGEFAIGTNTQAHIMAKKYDILPIMPILIVEKMGPHFAIGDTCFSWEEDFEVFNPIDGKEITARENERSAMRKTDIQKAYTNCHTDITLPYEELDFITGITKDGKKIAIIKDGRFVVPGTEEFNIPLDEWMNK